MAELLSGPIVLAPSTHSHNTLRCYRTVVEQSADVTMANPERGSGESNPQSSLDYWFFCTTCMTPKFLQIHKFSQLEVSKINLFETFSLLWL